jgi:hypothetical protein
MVMRGVAMSLAASTPAATRLLSGFFAMIVRSAHLDLRIFKLHTP